MTANQSAPTAVQPPDDWSEVATILRELGVFDPNDENGQDALADYVLHDGDDPNPEEN